ncbi:MAG: hypothetical protein AB6733_07160 [Clostridiaceae bacterium]
MCADTRHFSTSIEIKLYTRPVNNPSEDWREFDQGPGFFTIPDDQVGMIRARQINDEDLRHLALDLQGCTSVIMLDLAENRSVTDDGMAYLGTLPQITHLNLSSCDISNKGLIHLTEMPHLTWLNLSYCNRLNDNGVKTLRQLTHLTYMDIQGVLKISTAGYVQMQRKNFIIHR